MLGFILVLLSCFSSLSWICMFISATKGRTVSKSAVISGACLTILFIIVAIIWLATEAKVW